MKSPLAFFLLAAIASLGASATLTSCTTVESEQSAHTKKVRKQNTHSGTMRRHNRRHHQ